MSGQTLTCNECSVENAVGSKFCNNCGARLPETTKIMCPRCQTANTRDRMYCDNCGSRLISNDNVLPEEKTEEPAPAAKPFTLPARKPGDTGELNPDKVPDWLKTGHSDSEEEEQEDEDKTDEAGLPRLEDLTPQNRQTDDLPDWLIDEKDEEPIVHAPTIITTEHFQDLLRRERDGESDDKETADILGDDETDLPDWLAATSGIDASDPDETMPTYNAEDNLDWLEALSRPAGDEESKSEAAEPADQPDAESSGAKLSEAEAAPAGEPEPETLAEAEEIADTPDLIWPTGFLTPPDDDAEDTAVADKTPPSADEEDWLAELGPPQTNVLDYEDPDTGELEETPLNTNELIFPDEQLPDWMAELGPPQTNIIPSDDDSQNDSDDDSDDDSDEEPPVVTMQDVPLAEEDDLPDWLTDSEEAGDTSDEALSEVDWQPPSDLPAMTSSLDWLTETGELPPIEGSDADAVEAIEFDQLDDSFMDTEPPQQPNATDWLSELADLDVTAVDDSDTSTSDEENVDIVDAEPDIEKTDETVTDEAPTDDPSADDTAVADEEPAADEDTMVSTGAFLRGPVESDLPGWLSELDTTDMTGSQADKLVASENLPEWVSQLRPDEDQEGPGLTASMAALELDNSEFDDLSDDLVSAELPEWLQDVPALTSDDNDEQRDTAVTDEQVPAWLQADSQNDALDMALTSTEDSATIEEWDTILNNLPPGEKLAQADIPEWVQALKPRVLQGEEEQEDEADIGVEGTGPLAGIDGVIDIEPIITKPRDGSEPLKFISTKEQRQQADLLAQLAQKATPAATRTISQASDTSAGWLRLALAILLLATIILGLEGPNLLRTDVPAPTARLTAVHDTLASAAGQPILIAFEYTPAMAGELSEPASLLLADAAAGGGPILTMSQFAAGTAMASSTVTATAADTDVDARPIGFIPGEAIGLRQVGHCIASDIDCSTILGHQLDPDTEAALADVALIVVVTAERDSLVNWIEQVATPHDIPMVAAVTQSLAPVAEPYLASQQLAGVMQGITDAATYERTFTQQKASPLQERFQAQMLAQLLAAILLVLGLIIYGATSLINRNQETP